MNFATAGHVDHGKTALVRALTGTDTDRLAEEKRRGLTIDLGFAYLRKNDLAIGFVDVPGHTRFIHNMLVGVGAIDAALLLVAADDGVMPQTREHLAILQLLGVRRGALVVSKTDLVDAERSEQVAVETRRLVAGGCLEDLPLFQVSSHTGAGLPQLEARLLELAAAQSREAGDARREQSFRMPIDRAFNVKGAGLVVTGSVQTGRLSLEQEVQLSPGGATARVRALHAQNRPAETGEAGQRCAFNLTGPGIHIGSVSRGDLLVASGRGCVGKRFDASLALLGEAFRKGEGKMKVLRHWQPVRLHTGARQLSARVALLEGGSLAPGERALVQLSTAEPVDLVFGERFVLRDQSGSHTLGGGHVIEPLALARGRTKPARLARLRALDNPDAAAALAAALELHPAGLSLAGFLLRRNLPAPADTAPPDCVQLGGEERLLFGKAAWAGLKKELLAVLGACHERQPELPGLSSGEVCRRLPGFDRRAVEAALGELQKERLLGPGNSWRLASHQVQLPAPLKRHWQILRQALAGQAPPVVHDLAKQLRLPVREVQQCLQQAAKQGLLLRVADNRYLTPEGLQELALVAERLAGRPEGCNVREYRDATGIGRNFSIQVLEYFDSLGLTRRSGDQRFLQRGFGELVN